MHAALAQFLCGFAKKALIADWLAGYADPVFAEPDLFGASSIRIAAVCYTIQVYCDFSGYSDMALGTARLLGYELPANFRFPYLATSCTDFWHRWHISLSTWLRDYVYVPLGGNQGGRWRKRRNLVLTMLVGGFWHGGTWNFMAWAGVHATGLVVHKEWLRRMGPGRLGPLAWPLTMWTVMLAQIFFRAPDVPRALAMAKVWCFGAAVGSERLQLWPPVALLGPTSRCALIVASLAALHVLVSRGVHRQWRQRLPVWAVSMLLGAWTAAALGLMPLDARPFVYFRF